MDVRPVICVWLIVHRSQKICRLPTKKVPWRTGGLLFGHATGCDGLWVTVTPCHSQPGRYIVPGD